MTAHLPHVVATDDKESTPKTSKRPMVCLVVPAESYRSADFVRAARSLRVDLVVASDGGVPMTDLGRSRTLNVDFERPEWSAARIAHLNPPPDAVIAGDDKGVVIAAMASHLLGIETNPVTAVSMTKDKAHMRGLLNSAGVRQPRFAMAARRNTHTAANELGYPCVVKPRGLSASMGVIRVDTPDEAEFADGRIRRIIEHKGGDPEATLLVEEYVAGEEVAVEGLLTDGHLTVLAILDKPDPMVGPFFEETLFVTPSRHDDETQHAIADIVALAVRALGLVTGPIHAEVRLSEEGPVLIEIAARSIGGLCGRALSFGLLNESLEALIIRSALGMPGSGTESAVASTGVMMLPIPRAGLLAEIGGVADAAAVAGVTEVDVTIPVGKPVVPLPEGDRYLGFIFAQGASPDAVEASLREAYEALDVRIA
ncbi:MAG: ATP-grasp domain-containing protein [Acidimicrobiia bacterium]